ncbi:MAG: hypothetical protein C4291_06995 [Candidatus Dadabacteria bacterium]
MSYQLEGQLLEVCTCNVLCPCWIGEDPDGGTCDGVVAYHIDKGTVNGVDVSNLSFILLNHIPGNILKGNWRVAIYVDDRATPQQQEALLNAFGGKLGGPLADLAKLVGEIVGVERVPITFAVKEGRGTLHIGRAVEAELVPFQGATGKSTTLHDSVFTTIPGSPAYIGKALKYKARVPALGLEINLQNHNAIQGHFRFQG